ncbi:hypothetical protein IMCC3317_09860 [Kordia antarctica]|uniref:Uncharacterized protein n=1 Tax=Kordia antarctica TaxID=1218801 RepID=A0A7L4ZGJ3_9FLAO|nr:hypothetical protein [Kordia antarctica]QHI35640.1 hypothetical protein IMCC3317_09860 [Kordia antarctica]
MDSKQHLAISFYQHLGKLFYAIALADKKIKKVEFEVMKKHISLLNMEENLIAIDIKINIEHQITSTFNMLYFEETDAQTCFNDFVTFKRTYESLFTASLKNTILKIAGKIASGFSNINKSELMMLAKLSIELKK